MLSLFFPPVAAQIDWRTRPKLLAQELQKLGIKEEALGGQRVDFLIEVKTLSGERQVIFLHLEIQSRKERDFAERIYRYNQLIASNTKLDVVTLVVLADIDPTWRPGRYEREIMGCRVVMEYPVCKLLELVAQLENKRGFAALAALAQIAALETRGDAQKRLRKRLGQFPAVASLGSRQVGKTTLAMGLDIGKPAVIHRHGGLRTTAPYRQVPDWHKHGITLLGPGSNGRTASPLSIPFAEVNLLTQPRGRPTCPTRSRMTFSGI